MNQPVSPAHPISIKPDQGWWKKIYLAKTPGLLKLFYPAYTWHFDTKEKELYLTFDDGPHPVATPFVLNILKQYHAHATFFCIGKNVVAYPDLYRQVLDEGHAVGNHTQNHLNGWKTSDAVYLKDVAEASVYIDSDLFRPCYGRITSFQAKNLQAAMKGRIPKVIMWDVLSGDFDSSCSPEQSLFNVVSNAVPGSIIVFHDSEKALPRLQYSLPRVLQYFTEKGYSFKKI